jgi:hypothetical protein
MHILFF